MSAIAAGSHSLVIGPPMARVSGTVALEDIFAQAPAQSITFTFRPTDNSTPVTRSTEVTSDGDFLLSGVPYKVHVLHIKGEKWLAQNVMVDTLMGDVADIAHLLLAGDADNSNSVDVLDLDLLIQAFDSTPDTVNWNRNADFNCDESVDVLDLDILLRNFDAGGDE